MTIPNIISTRELLGLILIEGTCVYFSYSTAHLIMRENWLSAIYTGMFALIALIYSYWALFELKRKS